MQGELENLKSLLSAFAQEEPVLQKLLQKGEVEKLAEYMKADKAGKIVYAEAFRARPLEERRALAYIYGILLLNPVYGSPFNNFITNRFPQTAIDCPPFVNRGSMGPSGMWPIYAIHPEFFVDRSCQLFYTDEEIAGDADAAKWLAADIERESSGVSSAHMQQIQNLSWGDRVSMEPMYAVTLYKKFILCAKRDTTSWKAECTFPSDSEALLPTDTVPPGQVFGSFFSAE